MPERLVRLVTPMTTSSSSSSTHSHTQTMANNVFHRQTGLHLHDPRISINIIIGYDPITIHKSILTSISVSCYTLCVCVCTFFIIFGRQKSELMFLFMTLYRTPTHHTHPQIPLGSCYSLPVLLFPWRTRSKIVCGRDENRTAFSLFLSAFRLYCCCCCLLSLLLLLPGMLNTCIVSFNRPPRTYSLSQSIEFHNNRSC